MAKFQLIETLPTNPIDKAYSVQDDGIEVGYLQYRSATGQIGLIRLDEKYRGYGLGPQLLDIVAQDSGTDELFAVTTPNHPFWSKRASAIWTCPAGPGVTGCGYRFRR